MNQSSFVRSCIGVSPPFVDLTWNWKTSPSAVEIGPSVGVPYPVGIASAPAQPLADELAGAVEVGPLVEDDRDDGDAELGDRADLLDVRQPAHRPLDREREERLDLHRAQAGASVMTWTCTLVRSGTASIGRCRADQIPSPATRTASARTRKRFLSEASMRALSMGLGSPVSVRLVVTLSPPGVDRRPDGAGPPVDEAPHSSSVSFWRTSSLLSVKAPATTTRSPAARPESTTRRPSASRPATTGRKVKVRSSLTRAEDAGLPLDLLDRPGRDGQRDDLLGRVQEDPDEHPGPEQALGVGRLGEQGDGPRGRVDLLAHVDHRRLERPPWTAVGGRAGSSACRRRPG